MNDVGRLDTWKLAFNFNRDRTVLCLMSGEIDSLRLTEPWCDMMTWFFHYRYPSETQSHPRSKDMMPQSSKCAASSGSSLRKSVSKNSMPSTNSPVDHCWDARVAIDWVLAPNICKVMFTSNLWATSCIMTAHRSTKLSEMKLLSAV